MFIKNVTQNLVRQALIIGALLAIPLEMTAAAGTAGFVKGILGDAMKNQTADELLTKGTQAFGNMTRGLAESMQELYERKEQQAQYKFDQAIREQDRIAKDATLPPIMRKGALAEITRLRQQKHEDDNRMQNAAQQAVQGAYNVGLKAIDAGISELQAAASHDREKENLVIKSKIAGQAKAAAAREVAQFWGNWVQENPRLILGMLFGGTVATVGSYYALSHGSQLVVDSYKTPTAASPEDTDLPSFKQRFKRYFIAEEPETTQVTDVKLPKELSGDMTEMVTGLKNCVLNGSPLTNILLWGTPGTGKTMLAKIMARTSGMYHIYFPVSNFEQMTMEEATKQMKSFFEYRADKPIMIVLDEVELLGGSRTGSNLTAKMKALQNIVFGYAGDASPHHMVIVITNLPDQLDEAFNSRFVDKIEIPVPGAEQKREILDYQIDTWLIKAENKKPKSSGWFSWFSTPKEPKKVLVEDDALSEEARTTIVKQLDEFNVPGVELGFVGRDIKNIVLSFERAAFGTANCTLTREIVDRIVKKAIDTKRKEAEGFKRTTFAQQASQSA